MGASTGGIEAFEEFMRGLPPGSPPVAITQHITPGYLARGVERMNSGKHHHRITIARSGTTFQRGWVYYANDGGHLVIERNASGQAVAKTVPRLPDDAFMPGIDYLFHSVAKTYGDRAIGVILTGMGRDGVSGLAAMKASGARCIGQDRESSVVYGMPCAARAAGITEAEANPRELGRMVGTWTSGPAAGRVAVSGRR